MSIRIVAIAASCLVALTAVAACTDGVTPDCSNASVCAPIEGDLPTTGDAGSDAPTSSPDTGTAQPTPEASVVDAADGG